MKSIPRKELIRKFQMLGFEGPRRTGAHMFMRRGGIYVRIPGSENVKISAEIQRALLRQLEIDSLVWQMA